MWLALSLVLSLAFFRDFWASLPTMLSPQWVLGEYHVAPWGVLALCLLFLYLKRKEVWRGLGYGRSSALTPVGLGLIAGAVLMPSSQDYLVFQVLLASLGVFVVLFGRGAKIPSILLAIYGFAVSFPIVIYRFADEAYSQSAIAPVMGTITSLGYPFQSQGQWVHFSSSGGDSVSVAITAACAGPTTLGVFVALFALMTLDTPLPPKKAAKLFLFGVVGTYFQSFIRLVFLLLVGYYWGEDALWAVHYWTIYILFPLWYLLFAYIYFRQVGFPPGTGGRQGLKYTLATQQ
ncbi:MAG: exosortase/archaeosortase family protein [Dehalococcoidia bacterium]